MATITHAKTNNIPDPTQADLDAQIALGNYPPGTLLADISLPSDWNAAHTVSDIVNADISASAAIDASKIADGTVSSTEFQYINTLSSNAQTQIDSKLSTSTAASTYVPYTGATSDVDLGTNHMNAEGFSVTGTAGNGHIHLKHQSADATATGSSTALFANSNGDIKYKNDGGHYTTFVTSANTADRAYTFPDASVTLQGAMTLTTTGSSGAATFTGNTLNIPQYSGGAFNSISSGTNTTAAMIVGTGASLGASGSGTIIATSCTGNSATVTTNANLTGDITSVGNATTLTNAPVIAKVLTGFSASAGTVAATDTILQAFQKVVGNISALVTGVSSVFGRTGAVVATSGDYNTSQVTENTNLYFTDERAQDAVGAMVDTTLVYVDGTPLLTRAALTGDITAPQASNATTLATVNSNVGSFGSATQVGTFTVNAKGLVTAASNTTVTPAVGSITGLGTGVGTFLATPSSANLAAAVTDELGTGSLVFANSTYGFSASTTIATTVPASTFTKVEFNSEDFDPAGNYDATTNYRYTPLRAGKYYVSAIARVTFTNSAKPGSIAIYKNGAAYVRDSGLTTNQVKHSHIGALIDMNGSTDYLEVFIFQGDSVSGAIDTTSGYSRFSAFLTGV